MNEIHLRKQALLLESELHRAALRADLTQLAASAAWIDHTVGVVQKTRPLFLALGAGAGLLLARRLTGPRGGGGSGLWRWLRWGQMAYGVWRTFAAWRERRAGPSPAP
jgi:hypothetical protein